MPSQRVGRITGDITTDDGLAFDRNERVELKRFADLDEEEKRQLCGAGLADRPPTKKKCPYCAEVIKFEAIKCRFCGSELDPETAARTAIKNYSVDEVKFCIAYSRNLSRYVLLLRDDVSIGGDSSNDKPRPRPAKPMISPAASLKDTKPRCPTCGSTRIHRLSRTWKVTKVASVGVFGLGNVHKIFKCRNCGYKWP